MKPGSLPLAHTGWVALGPCLQHARPIFLRQPGTLGEWVGAGRDDAGLSLTTGGYLAPRFSQWGKPKLTTPRKNARDAAMARRLWDVSVELPGAIGPFDGY